MQLKSIMTVLASAAQDIPPGSILAFDAELLFGIGLHALNIIALVAVLAFLLYKPVKKFLSERTQRIEAQLAAAQQAQLQADVLIERYETQMRQISVKREEILRDAHARAAEHAATIIEQAKAEAEQLRLSAAQKIELDRKTSMEDMKREMVEIAAMMAGHLMGQTMDKQTHERYIDEAIRDLEGGAWLN